MTSEPHPNHIRSAWIVSAFTMSYSGSREAVPTETSKCHHLAFWSLEKGLSDCRKVQEAVLECPERTCWHASVLYPCAEHDDHAVCADSRLFQTCRLCSMRLVETQAHRTGGPRWHTCHSVHWRSFARVAQGLEQCSSPISCCAKV